MSSPDPASREIRPPVPDTRRNAAADYAAPLYEISTEPARIDAVAAHAFLATAYWSRGIPFATVARALAHSVCAAAFDRGRQVAFARAVTDRATFAYIADVYVLEDHRGRGLGRRIVEALLAHPDLQGLRRMMLATRDAHRLYAGQGFAPLADPVRFMERHHQDCYAGAPVSLDPYSAVSDPGGAGEINPP